MQNTNKNTSIITLFVDLLIVNLSLVIAFYIRYPEKVFYEDVYYLNLLLFYSINWIFCTYIFSSYKIVRISSIEKILKSIARSIFLHILLVAVFWVLIKGYFYSRQILILSYVFLTGGILIWRIGNFYYKLSRRKLGHNLNSIIIVGKGQATLELSSFFKKNPQFGYSFKGFFHDESGEDVIGGLKDIEHFVKNNKVDEIYCLVPYVNDKMVGELNVFSERNTIRFKIVPDIKSYYYSKTTIDIYGSTPVLHLKQYPLDQDSSKFIKRAFDIFFSLFAIIFVFSWLFPIVSIIIKLESRGPIFFVQKRSGKNNETFNCFKFRSMKYFGKDNEFVQATKGDTRITKMGAFIRKTSIDEMPQFFNVLLGNMSVVGPRPHPLKLDEEYKGIIDKYMSRHFAKPGITGLSQVMGYRGETKDTFSMKARVNLDSFYIEHWTFFLDIKIILLTIFNIFKKEDNAY